MKDGAGRNIAPCYNNEGGRQAAAYIMQGLLEVLDGVRDEEHRERVDV